MRYLQCPRRQRSHHCSPPSEIGRKQPGVPVADHHRFICFIFCTYVLIFYSCTPSITPTATIYRSLMLTLKPVLVVYSTTVIIPFSSQRHVTFSCCYYFSSFYNAQLTDVIPFYSISHFSLHFPMISTPSLLLISISISYMLLAAVVVFVVINRFVSEQIFQGT